MSTLGGKNLVWNFHSQEKFGPPWFCTMSMGWLGHSYVGTPWYQEDIVPIWTRWNEYPLINVTLRHFCQHLMIPLHSKIKTWGYSLQGVMVKKIKQYCLKHERQSYPHHLKERFMMISEPHLFCTINIRLTPIWPKYLTLSLFKILAYLNNF
jgi:hypothetical protein